MVRIFIRYIFHRLPLSVYHRRALQSWCYESFPWLFKNTVSYQLWKTWLKSESDFLVNTVSPSISSIHFSSSSPDVSVIVVSTEESQTLRCLQYIFMNSLSSSCEVILIASKDVSGMSKITEKIKGAQIISCDEGLGFSRLIELSLTKAKGQYLLFLHDKIVLSPEVIQEGLSVFRKNTDAGIVGGKLIGLDRKIVNAGGAIDTDDACVDVGVGENMHLPMYNYMRQVDYCSKSLFMMSTTFAKELHGFSDSTSGCAVTNFNKSMYKAAQMHKKQIIYQPLITAIEAPYEGGVKSYIEKRDTYLFRNRWAAADLISVNPSPKALKSYSKGRILIIDACTPTPDRDAGSVTAFYFMQIFSELGLQVTFIPGFDFLRQPGYTDDLQRIGVECLYGPYVTSVEEYLKKHGRLFDAVLLYRVEWASSYIAPVRKYAPQAKIIFDTVDLHYLREERQAASENSEELVRKARATKIKEFDVMRASDITIVLSDIEKEILALEIPEVAVKAIPLILDIPGIAADYDQREGIVFIGGYNHEPNVDAVMYFAEQIWPLVKQRIPSITFYILGSNPPPQIKALDGKDIKVIGYVESLDDYFNNCRLSIVPLRYGAGIKGKIGTSFSYGLPVVSTSVGVEGMGIEANKHALIGDDPETFAAAVARLYLDQECWQSLSAAGLEFVTDRYSLDAGRKTLSDLLKQLDIDHLEYKKDQQSISVSIN